MRDLAVPCCVTGLSVLCMRQESRPPSLLERQLVSRCLGLTWRPEDVGGWFAGASVGEHPWGSLTRAKMLMLSA